MSSAKKIDKNLLIRSDPNIENQTLLHINRLSPRATVVPAQRRGVYYTNKFDSTHLRSLNGDYRFRYLPEDTEPDFWRTEMDDRDWDTIDVPSMWQFRGYGKPEYPNVKYSIPFAPPFVKKPNPVGLYRRVFHVDTPAERTILHFAGVDNAYYVYLNDTLVGLSKGSRLPAEFDVSSLIRKGDNLLAVKVFTYSDATYLENQDMLLASGIFRDVYLIESRRNTLWDYRVTTTYDSITVELKLSVETPFRVRLSLDGDTVEYDAAPTLRHTFSLTEPRLWSAELPNLYDLAIELTDGSGIFETHSKRVGILRTRVEGNKLLVNETPIYIKGVNRHENDAHNGRALTVAQIRRDLERIKANNLNAIRLSHYTNDPATYEIAAELGLYLMDEADLETHGAYAYNGDQGYLSKDPSWLPAYKDRILRMLETNKNEVAIFLWSTGNEAGYGENLVKCAQLVREFDPTRECFQAQDDIGFTHFRGVGYYPMSRVEEMPDEGYPILAIEYAHAMGNSPGTLEDYWDYNYTHEKMLGGFVWEFRSHGFYAEDGNGTPYYQYGGDFDDVYHWSNFTLDGYCRSDGTPKPAWYELGAVSFAAYTTFRDGVLTVKNTNDFRDLSYLRASYEITEDGRPIRSGALSLPRILPHESAQIPVDCSVSDPNPGARYHLNVLYREGERLVHKKQFPLELQAPPCPFAPKKAAAEHSVDNYILTVRYGDFTCSFTGGMLSRLTKGDRILLDRPMKLNLHRAYTDNDGIVSLAPRRMGEWQKALLHEYYFNLHDIDVEETEDRTVVTVAGRFTANSQCAGFLCQLRYEVYPDGVVLVTLQGEPYGKLPDTLPRIGVTLETDKSLDTVRWLGRGPLENYPDSKANAQIGQYEQTLAGLNFDYDVPQETGNRENTHALTLT
ncbi:MAG: DUF4981 domain-containing protein, partial [Clostridia bacterium]|nr:DUF4981 domain-containing protein [Clostridia bacterium]